MTLAEQAEGAWAFGVLVLPLVGAAWVHLVWLLKHGINGWTAESRDRYVALIQSRRRGGVGP